MENTDRFISRCVLDAGEDTSNPLLEKTGEWIEQGRKVYRMDMGTPDIDCSDAVKEEAFAAMQRGETRYTDARGISRLRRAIAEKMKKERGLDVDPEKNVVVTVGASEALYLLMGVFLDPGDEVLIPSPWYCAYYYVPTAFGIKVKEVPILRGCDLVVDLEAFEAQITEKTRMLLLNSPHNPTGLSYTREQLEQFAALAKKYDLLVVSDECYDKYLFEGTDIGIETLPGMAERTIIINSVSKSYGMTGWRVGYIVAPEYFQRALVDIHGNLILCAPSFCQYGAAKALETETEEQMDRLRAEYLRRRDLVIRTLDEIDGIDYVYPRGAFYVFASVEKLGISGLAFCERFLEEYSVSVMPGEIFGSCYDGFIRFAYTSSYEDIEEAMRRLKEFTACLEREKAQRIDTPGC